MMRIVLVDDHAVVREGLKRLLDPLINNWSIVEAGTGYQALECLQAQHFDLAIVDLSMPGMSGLDLIGRIRSEFPQVAVLVLLMPQQVVQAVQVAVLAVLAVLNF